MSIIGIDPGIDGAMACIAETGQVSVWDLPSGATPKGKRELDRYRVLSGLGALPDGPVWMEQVASMPGQGVSSSFRFGETVGILKMAVAACGRELRMVPASKWKRHFGLIFPKGTPKASIKNASRMMACSRFPQIVDQLARVKDADRAEALLIALYGAEVRATLTDETCPNCARVLLDDDKCRACGWRKDEGEA